MSGQQSDARAIAMLFVGKRLNGRVRLLRELSIPEPVTGGLRFSVLLAVP